MNVTKTEFVDLVMTSGSILATEILCKYELKTREDWDQAVSLVQKDKPLMDELSHNIDWSEDRPDYSLRQILKGEEDAQLCEWILTRIHPDKPNSQEISAVLDEELEWVRSDWNDWYEDQHVEFC